MASPPPPPPTSPPPPTIKLRKDATTAPASPASSASADEAQPRKPKPSQHGITNRRLPSGKKPSRKSRRETSSARTPRQLRDEFNHQQRQNRAWLHHQLGLPGRGRVGHVAEGELRALFGKDIEAHPETNLPMLKSGMTLSPAAEDGWRRLQQERKAAQEELGRRAVPAWWDIKEIVPRAKKTRGEQRAAKREREMVDRELGIVGGLEIGAGGGVGAEGGVGGGEGDGDVEMGEEKRGEDVGLVGEK